MEEPEKKKFRPSSHWSPPPQFPSDKGIYVCIYVHMLDGRKEDGSLWSLLIYNNVIIFLRLLSLSLYYTVVVGGIGSYGYFTRYKRLTPRAETHQVPTPCIYIYIPKTQNPNFGPTLCSR